MRPPQSREIALLKVSTRILIHFGRAGQCDLIEAGIGWHTFRHSFGAAEGKRRGCRNGSALTTREQQNDANVYTQVVNSNKRAPQRQQLREGQLLTGAFSSSRRFSTLPQPT